MYRNTSTKNFRKVTKILVLLILLIFSFSNCYIIAKCENACIHYVSFVCHSGLCTANIGWLDYSNQFQSTITIVLLSVLFLLYMFCCSKLLPTTWGYWKRQYWHCLSYRFKEKVSHLSCCRVGAFLFNSHKILFLKNLFNFNTFIF